MNLSTRLRAVHDEQTFLAFARALLDERLQAATREVDGHATDWANNTIADFLESAIAWAEDSEFGATQGLACANPWQRFATFLYCGKIYE